MNKNNKDMKNKKQTPNLTVPIIALNVNSKHLFCAYGSFPTYQISKPVIQDFKKHYPTIC